MFKALFIKNLLFYLILLKMIAQIKKKQLI